MTIPRSLRPLVVLLLPLLSLSAGGAAAEEKPLDFNRDVRPILSDKCYRCHGPDAGERATDLRLDVRESALGEAESGEPVIAPGDPEGSELLYRITTNVKSERMPPAKAGKTLSEEEVEILRRWIAQGAPWREHWAFHPPEQAPLPEVKNTQWPRGPIDRFLLARLEAEGLSPAPEASREALIRRATLDLTGLPPTPEEIDAFLAEDSPGAYERLLDRLLASPRYGEHRARYWLDAARYGDTHGLHLDNRRSIWPYRDWVIAAFNRNQPFNEFTIEQLAGDLLPQPTVEQRVATGFNRCNVTTSEGGSIAAEYLVRYAVDRVETTSTVWLGLTAGCAACHDHKFDPLTQKEFYGLFSYFYSLTENAMDGNALLPPPFVKALTPSLEAEKRQWEEQLSALRGKVRETLKQAKLPEEPAGGGAAARRDFVWIDDALPRGAKGEGNSPWKFVGGPEHPVHSGASASTRTAPGLSQHFFTGADPPLVVGEGDVLFAHVYLDPQDPPKEIMLQWNDGSWEHRAYWGGNEIDWGAEGTASRRRQGDLPPAGEWVRLEVPAAEVGLSPGAKLNGWAFTQFGGTVYWDTAGIHTLTPQAGERFATQVAWEEVQRGTGGAGLPAEVKQALLEEPAKRSAEQTAALRLHYLEHGCLHTQPLLEPLQREAAELERKIAALAEQAPGTLVMEEMNSVRQAFLLHRGEYDKQGEPVARGVPAWLPPLPEGAPNNRLGLAQWLVEPGHPLTARVTVNRFWQNVFGTGLVQTSEDFGSQGEWPSHPELLDWLAVDFVQHGWDVKRLMKQLLSTAAYRQSAAVTPEKLARDPRNRLLSRGPRHRLDAEVIRDQALAVSGLLVEKLGGPSVKPYQPEGLWEAVGYSGSNTVRFEQDHGEALYRRSMYTFWKRTSPPPSLQIFDAPSREYCVVRRSRTNTPTAALVLMNDIQYVEAARHLAERLLKLEGAEDPARLERGFRLVTARLPNAREREVLTRLLARYRERYAGDEAAAAALLAVGESPRDGSLPVAEHAAWTLLASTLLNLDETITKE